MKKVIQALCALIIIVGVSITGGTKANAYDTIHGIYYWDSVQIHTKGRHDATVLGLAYTNEHYTTDCAALKGDSSTYPWDHSKSTTWWLSARDTEPRSGVKGYSSVGYMMSKNTTLFEIPAGVNYYMQNSDYCMFDGKTGPYSAELN
jgi:hypothetical protein